MRLKLTLQCQPGTRLPRDSHYPLSSAIYHILRKSDPEYAEFLHNTGYQGEKRRYKPFTFSWLYPPPGQFKADRNNPALMIVQADTLDWYLSSPVDEFLQNIVNGFFETGGVSLYREHFNILSVETLPEPDFTGEMNFRCLSPFVLSTQRDDKSIEYFKEDGPRLDEAITNNLRNKFQLLHQTTCDDALILRFDPEQKRKRRRLTKTIRIKPGKPDETILVGMMGHFTLTGSANLIRVAYESGLGEHTAMGCGMIDVVDPQVFCRQKADKTANYINS